MDQKLTDLKKDCKDFIVFDLECSRTQHIDGWTETWNCDQYLFIGEKTDGKFITCIIEYITSMTFTEIEAEPEWEIFKTSDANFVHMTLDYQFQALFDSRSYRE